MDDLASVLPVLRTALRNVEDSEHRALDLDFIDFVKQMSEKLMKYSSQPAIEFLSRNWYLSKKEEVDEYKAKVGRMKQNVTLVLTAETQTTTLAVSEQVGIARDLLFAANERQLDKVQREVLDRIRPPKLCSLDPSRRCMQGTRASVIREIADFAFADDQLVRLYWLYGIAGSGKSSVATSVATSLRAGYRLCGAFFCKRDVPELRIAINLLHFMAYSIAEVYEAYRSTLLNVLQKNSCIEDGYLIDQFDTICLGRMRGL